MKLLNLDVFHAVVKWHFLLRFRFSTFNLDSLDSLGIKVFPMEKCDFEQVFVPKIKESHDSESKDADESF